MKRFIVPLLLCLICAAAFAQDKPKDAKPEAALPTTKLAADAKPMDIARAAFAAQGGETWRKLKSLFTSGSLDVYSSTSTINFSGKFVTITAGDKLRREINAPPAPFVRIISDGFSAYVSVPGVNLPPSSAYGVIVLRHFDEPGFTVGPLQGKEKKKRGFSITTPEGYVTDFYVDPDTARLIGYSFVYDGYVFGSEFKKLTVLNGVLIPYQYTEVLNLPVGAFYLEFKVKEAKTDIELADDVFAFPTKG
jgi:hypothetical protein